MTEPKKSQEKNKHHPLSLLTSAVREIKQTTIALCKYIIKSGYTKFTVKS